MTAVMRQLVLVLKINPAYFYKQALIELAKERYFGQLANVRAMPKNMGKTIKQHHYLPLLDDANINDQGIDALGAAAQTEATIITTDVFTKKVTYHVGNDPTPATAVANAEALALAYWVATYGTANVNYATDKAQLLAMHTPPHTVDEPTPVEGQGNLYGSSKDIGYITGKLPSLTEHGGRVNRVGFTRKTIQATIAKFGFFDEYTQESLDFDTDSQLLSHITREALRGANETTEDQLQMDLLAEAGVVRFTGDALDPSELQGTTTAPDALVYDDLMRLGIELDNNRCPKSTEMITGSRLVDTKVITGARYMYVGSEMIPTLRRLKSIDSSDVDGSGFIPVEKYAAAGNVANGEIGSVDQFRIIVVPEMMHWASVGAVEGVNGGYRATAGKYDVFPMLVVGSGSFTTIGFQTDGKTVKFKIVHKKPGKEIANRDDPYGETGFYSIKWYYGFMALRPEWIGLIKTIAEQ